MPRLTPRDVWEILDMLENGIVAPSKLGKIERMKMRSKIRRQEGWISALHNPTAEFILQRLQESLSDVFPLYSYDFKEKSQRARFV
jgi:hypothetical protein